MLLHGDFLRIQYYSLVARRGSGTDNFHPSLARHLKEHHYKFCFSDRCWWRWRLAAFSSLAEVGLYRIYS